MFKLDANLIKERQQILDHHKTLIAAADIYYQYIRLIIGHTKVLDRKCYEEYYRNILADIEIETPPLQTFIICDETVDVPFLCDRECPEYKRIANRLNSEGLCVFDTLPQTHDVIMHLNAKDVTMDDVIDDVFINHCVIKYTMMLTRIRMDIGKNLEYVINYVLNCITIDDFRMHNMQTKINDEKCSKYLHDTLFTPDLFITEKYYASEHGDLKPIDLSNLLGKLTTNITIKSDILIVLAVYYIMSFAMGDLEDLKQKDAPCVTYVRDVISKI